MKHLQIPDVPGVIYGDENNPDLFIRNVVFDAGYTEDNYHNHPNSYEFYIVLSGALTFQTSIDSVEATQSSIVYFEEAEPHKIALVKEKTEMLLIKKVGSKKEE